jgi:hypothetical protein
MAEILKLLQLLGIPFRELKLATGQVVRHYYLPGGQVLELVLSA